MNIHGTLKKIIADRQTHACWLNSLSYLEYRGFRKIVRSRTTDEMSLEILMHTSEEVRHALFFKKHAVKLGGEKFRFYRPESLLCETALKVYFYQLDTRAVASMVGLQDQALSQAAYVLVTWLVETRALAIYHQYEELLRSGDFSFSLQGLLREEQNHLDEMGLQAQSFLHEKGYDVEAMIKIEEDEFNKLWTSLDVSLVESVA